MCNKTTYTNPVHVHVSLHPCMQSVSVIIGSSLGVRGGGGGGGGVQNSLTLLCDVIYELIKVIRYEHERNDD